MNVHRLREAEAAFLGRFPTGFSDPGMETILKRHNVDGLADFYKKVWSTGEAGAEVPMRVVRDGRDTWLRVKSADRNAFLRRPHLQ